MVNTKPRVPSTEAASDYVPQFLQMEELSESINMLVYADSGAGKTVFGGSDDNVLILSAERGGSISAKYAGSTATIVRVKKWSDLVGTYNWLYDNPDHGYQWIVLDSLTKMQQMGMRAILEDVKAENGKRDIDLPSQGDHQKWQNMFRRMVDAFVDLDVNCLFLAQAMMVDDEEGEPFLTPDIAGKGFQISQQICGAMSCYGYLQVVRQANKATGKTVLRRKITWRDNGKIRAKSRYPSLNPYTVDKSLKQIREMIENEPAPVAATK